MKRCVVLGVLLVYLGAFFPGASRAEEIYRGDELTLAFSSPEGWEKSSVMISFSPPKGTGDVTITQISIMVHALPDVPMAPELIEKTAEMMKTKDPSSMVEVIDFAGTKAVSSASDISGMMTRQILFTKDGKQYVLIFVAEGEDYELWLPAVEESFKSFQATKVLNAGAGPAI